MAFEGGFSSAGYYAVCIQWTPVHPVGHVWHWAKQVAHILLSPDKKDLIPELRRRVEGGEALGELAAQHSQCPSRGCALWGGAGLPDRLSMMGAGRRGLRWFVHIAGAALTTAHTPCRAMQQRRQHRVDRAGADGA